MTDTDTSTEKLEGQSFPALLEQQAIERPLLPAVSWLCDGRSVTLNWREYRDRVRDLASGFVKLGVDPGDTIAILSSNRVEHLLADTAAVHSGAIPVSVYPTLAPEQLTHVIGDIAPTLVVVDNPVAASRVADASQVPEHRIIVIDADEDGSLGLSATRSWAELEATGASTRAEHDKEIDVRVAAIELDNPLTYVYSSGTTGPPKGVILTHRNMLSQAFSMSRMPQFNFDRLVSHLPLAHIVERLWSLYMPMLMGSHVLCCPDPARLLDGLRAHRPTYLMTVPRVWEKLGQTAREIMGSSEFDAMRGELERDRSTLADEWTLRQKGELVPTELAAAARLAREGAVHDVQAALGVDLVSTPSSGAAAMNSGASQFLATIGLEISEGYGLTENAGPAICERPGIHQVGSVGLPIPGWEVRIDSDGEILLKGGGNTPGYRNRPEETAELFTEDGWLRTGDVGHLDASGRLHITDRKKEIIVNAAGKNIAPSAIEGQLGGRSFIDQAMVFGESRPYVVALLTVDEPRLKAFASAQGIGERDVDELTNHPIVLSEVNAIIEDANSSLSRPEQVKKASLLAKGWTVESGEVTPTFKLRRKVIQENYRDRVDALYTPNETSANPLIEEEKK